MTERESPFSSSDPADIAWRTQQSYVHGEIEGIQRDPKLAAFVDKMDADGIPIDEQIKRIAAFEFED